MMRIFKLARRSVGLQSMAHTVKTSWKVNIYYELLKVHTYFQFELENKTKLVNRCDNSELLIIDQVQLMKDMVNKTKLICRCNSVLMPDI